MTNKKYRFSSCFTLLFITLFLSGCAGNRGKTSGYMPMSLTLESDGKVKVPLTAGPHSGWILINQRIIKRYGFTDANIAAIPFYPEKGYGDIFFLQEYENIDKTNFLSGIVVYRMKDLLPKKKDEECNSIEINWKSCDKNKDQLYYSLKKSIESISKNDEERNALILQFLKHGKKINDFDTEKSESIERDTLKERLKQVMVNIRDYPPKTLFGSEISNTRLFAARKTFSTFTVKSSVIFAPSKQAVSPTAHISVYPAVTFATRENHAKYLDRISLDIGMVDKSEIDSTNKEYNDADSRFLFGVGFNLSNDFSIQAGDLIWFQSDKTNHDFFFGVSLDIFNLGAKFTK